MNAPIRKIGPVGSLALLALAGWAGCASSQPRDCVACRGAGQYANVSVSQNADDGVRVNVGAGRGGPPLVTVDVDTARDDVLRLRVP